MNSERSLSQAPMWKVSFYSQLNKRKSTLRIPTLGKRPEFLSVYLSSTPQLCTQKIQIDSKCEYILYSLQQKDLRQPTKHLFVTQRSCDTTYSSNIQCTFDYVKTRSVPRIIRFSFLVIAKKKDSRFQCLKSTCIRSWILGWKVLDTQSTFPL